MIKLIEYCFPFLMHCHITCGLDAWTCHIFHHRKSHIVLETVVPITNEFGQLTGQQDAFLRMVLSAWWRQNVVLRCCINCFHIPITIPSFLFYQTAPIFDKVTRQYEHSISDKTMIKNTIGNFSLKHKSPFNGLCLGWRSIWNLQVSNKLPPESALNPPVQIKLSSSSLAIIYEDSRI